MRSCTPWLLAPLSLLALTGCPTTTPTPSEPEPEKTGEATGDGIVFENETLKLADLKLETAQAVEAGKQTSVTGTLEADPAATAIVTARVDGKIIRLAPNVGDSVATDAVIAIVESEKLHEAQLSHALAVKRLEAAEADLARRRSLARLGAYSRPDLEEARKAETEAQAALEHAQGEIRASESLAREARSRVAAQEAQLQQAETALSLARSQVSLAEKQVQRSERLLAEELVSRREHEETLAQHEKVAAEEKHARAGLDFARARHRELETGVESAQVRIETATKAVVTARQRLALARQAKLRGEAVYKGGFLTTREVAEAEVAVAQARVSAEGALDDVQLLGGQPGDNHSIPIHAPFAGRVLERKATLGQTIHAGEPILTLINPRTLFAQLSVFPADLSQVQSGQRITLSMGPRTAQGVVERLSDVADEKTHAVRVRVRVDNRAGILRPGMPVTARFSGTRQKVVLVPSGAVQVQDGKRVVYIPAQKSGAFLAREVKIGIAENGKTAILSGLRPGETFVSKNAFLVKSQAMKGELGEEE